jgi:hypothetical protein
LNYPATTKKKRREYTTYNSTFVTLEQNIVKILMK